MSMFNWTKVNDHEEISFIRFDYYKTISGKYAVRLLSGFGTDAISGDSPVFAAMPKIKYLSSKNLARRAALELLSQKRIDDSLISAFDNINLWGEL